MKTYLLRDCAGRACACQKRAYEERLMKAQKLSKAQASKLARFGTKSAKIRYLHSLKWSRSDIAAKLGIRYQHVRNVLITPVKKAKES